MTQLDDLLLTHQLLLLRLANDEANKMVAQYADIAKKIRDEILLGDALSNMGKRELNAKIAKLNSFLEIEAPDLEPIAEFEISYINQVYSEQSGFPALAVVGGALLLSEWSKYSAVQQTLNGVAQQGQVAVADTIRRMAANGATNDEIAKAVIGDRRTNKGGEPLKRMERGADARLKTEILATAGIIRDLIVKANPEQFSYAQHVSVIDSRTTDTCVARNLKIWSLPDYKAVDHSFSYMIPPLHPNCRSYIRYYRKGEASLTQLKEAQTDFNDFLKRNPDTANEVLGKGRAELYLAGKITLADLVDSRNNPISLQMLKQQV
jgi:hypothetical protein